MTRAGYTLTILVGASLGVAACTNSIDEAPEEPPPSGGTTGGSDTTFDHENEGISPFELLDRLTRQGPPSFTSRLHACAKVRYETLGNVLASLGVNLDNATNLSAGKLYRDAATAYGAPNYANRIRENINITTSGASSEFDIFAAAAPEVIAALPNLERCKLNGVAPVLFEGTSCRAEGITCLIGAPAQPGHVEICSLTLQRASDPTIGQRLAVAALLAAAYTCE
jgi:hypothetical protein